MSGRRNNRYGNTIARGHSRNQLGDNFNYNTNHYHIYNHNIPRRRSATDLAIGFVGGVAATVAYASWTDTSNDLVSQSKDTVAGGEPDDIITDEYSFDSIVEPSASSDRAEGQATSLETSSRLPSSYELYYPSDCESCSVRAPANVTRDFGPRLRTPASHDLRNLERRQTGCDSCRDRKVRVSLRTMPSVLILIKFYSV